MGVFWVHLAVTKEDGKHIALTWEVPGIDTVEALAEKFAEKGVVAGFRLNTIDDSRGGRTIVSRFPTALTILGITQITPNIIKLWEK